MPNDIARVRQIQGHHANHLARQLSRVPPALAAPDRLNGAGPLNIRNRPADCLLATLLFSTAMSQLRLPEAPPRRQQALPPNARLAQRSGLRPSATQLPPTRHPGGGGGLGVHASPGTPYTQMQSGDGSAAQLLNHVGNSLDGISSKVVTACALKPAECSRAVLAGLAAATGVAASGLVGFLAGRSMNPPCATDLPPTAETMPTVQTLLNALPAEDRTQVLEIVSACGGDPACAIPEIHTVLERLPPAVQRQLAVLVPAEIAAELPAGAWPPAANAVVMPPGVNWIDQLANVLGIEIRADEAAFDLAVERIAEATANAQRSSSVVKQRHHADEARRQAIVDLFEEAGFNVERRPFTLTTRTGFGFPYNSSGQNLRVTLDGTTPIKRTLLLLAHGDVMGAEDGSTGALDNASGVVALLALARQLKAEGLPDGTRVQFLVTDKEEVGMHGAKFEAAGCVEADDCPDVALNVDVIGAGDGLTLSGTAEHVLYRDGDSRPRGNDTRPVRPAETQLAQHLRTAAAKAGVQVHPADGWTMQSDHIAFQREGVPGLGVTQIDATGISLERNLQQARLRNQQAQEAIDWDQYDDFVDGRLNSTQEAAFQRAYDAADTLWREYQALPRSERREQIHGPADQPARVDSRTAMKAVRVLHDGVRAWLAAPPAREAV